MKKSSILEGKPPPFQIKIDVKFEDAFLKTLLQDPKAITRSAQALKKKQKSSLWTGKLQLLQARPASVGQEPTGKI